MTLIQNKQLVRPTRLVYTVGPTLSGAAHQTVQAAINKAIADGATEAEIQVFAGYYNENVSVNSIATLSINGGGRSTTFLDGTLTITLDPASNFVQLADFEISGALTVTGAATDASLQLQNVTSVNVSVAAASAVPVAIRVYDSEIIGGGADSLVMGDNCTLTWFGGVLGSVRTVRAVELKQVSSIRDADVRGRVEKANVTTFGALGPPSLTMVGTTVRAQSQECVRLLSNEPSVADLLQNCNFFRETSSGPAIVLNESAGVLTHGGNSYLGTVTDPVISVLAGTEVIGAWVEPTVRSVETLPRGLTNLSDVLWSGGGGGFGDLYCAAIDVYQPTQIDRLQAWCSQAPGGAGGLALGIYTSAGARVDYSAISSPSVGINTRTLLSGSRSLAPGQYYLAIYCNQNGARFALFNPALSETGMGFLVPNSGSLDATGFPASVAGFLSNLSVKRYWVGGRNG